MIGDLLFNGRPALKFRIPKKQVSECVAFSKKFGDDVVLGKNRDRNYTPELKVVREMSGNGIELCYMVDQDTDWSEGMNSNGIGLVNSALFVKRDEKDFDKSKKEKAPSKDGIRIRHALSKDTLTEVVKSLVNFGTRHTLSDTVSKIRGIGVARRWIKSTFEEVSENCDNCKNPRERTEGQTFVLMLLNAISLLEETQKAKHYCAFLQAKYTSLPINSNKQNIPCLLYTSDAADE